MPPCSEIMGTWVACDHRVQNAPDQRHWKRLRLAQQRKSTVLQPLENASLRIGGEGRCFAANRLYSGTSMLDSECLSAYMPDCLDLCTPLSDY